VLETESTAVGEHDGEEGAQGVDAAMEGRCATRLAQLAARRELLEDAREIATRQAIVVAAHDVGQHERGDGGQNRAAHQMEAEERLHGVVDAYRVQQRTRRRVARYRHRQRDDDAEPDEAEHALLRRPGVGARRGDVLDPRARSRRSRWLFRTNSANRASSTQPMKGSFTRGAPVKRSRSPCSSPAIKSGM
jgi:hypothetical protein